MKNKTENRSVKHTFTQPEVADLNVRFGQSYDALLSATAELKSVTTSYKARVSEAESRMTSLRSTINAGFEFREKKCVIVLDVEKGKKFLYLETDCEEGEPKKDAEPVITEQLTNDDLQAALIAAEGEFEQFEEIQLFPPTDNDRGVLAVGRQKGKWFSALRVQIGARKIEERLDSEQTCSKKRSVQIDRSLARFYTWLVEQLGRDTAQGFKNQLELVKVEHAEREE